jgi:hypothetical protein
VFWLLSGESRESLREGRRVEALIRWVGNEEARCQLPAFNNLDALLHRNDISSQQPPPEPRDRLRVGDTVAARSAIAPSPFMPNIGDNGRCSAQRNREPMTIVWCGTAHSTKESNQVFGVGTVLFSYMNQSGRHFALHRSPWCS